MGTEPQYFLAYGWLTHKHRESTIHTPRNTEARYMGYYQPCIAALFGTNVGNNPDTEPQYFLAYGWLTHDACAHLSCLADNMLWNRRNGGCLPSGILGAPPTDTYDEADDENFQFCARGSDDNE